MNLDFVQKFNDAFQLLGIDMHVSVDGDEVRIEGYKEQKSYRVPLNESFNINDSFLNEKGESLSIEDQLRKSFEGYFVLTKMAEYLIDSQYGDIPNLIVYAASHFPLILKWVKDNPESKWSDKNIQQLEKITAIAKEIFDDYLKEENISNIVNSGHNGCYATVRVNEYVSPYAYHFEFKQLGDGQVSLNIRGDETISVLGSNNDTETRTLLAQTGLLYAHERERSKIIKKYGKYSDYMKAIEEGRVPKEDHYL